MENIADRKVVEGNAERTRQPDPAAEAGAQFKLVAGFFLDRIVDVHSSVVRIRHRVNTDLFLVKEAEVGDLPLRADQVRTAEFLAGDRPELPPDHIVLGAVVTGYPDILDRGLGALDDTDLVIDR